MKSVLILTSVLLGSGLLLTDSHQTGNLSSTNTKVFKRATTGNGPLGNISIIIDKSDYELSVYDEKGWFATYPVVFGSNGLDDKRMEGDKKTPEGSFHVISKRVHEKWYRFLALDYPSKESWEKFNLRKQRGEIPASASIGGGVGIHGTWPHEDYAIDQYQNWTEGCISTKNNYIQEIFALLPVGTTVEIRH